MRYSKPGFHWRHKHKHKLRQKTKQRNAVKGAFHLNKKPSLRFRNVQWQNGTLQRDSLVNNGRLVGAFHWTEIPEILLENQMEHVNFWNAVSLILKNLTLPLKSLLSAFAEINPDSRH